MGARLTAEISLQGQVDLADRRRLRAAASEALAGVALAVTVVNGG